MIFARNVTKTRIPLGIIKEQLMGFTNINILVFQLIIMGSFRKKSINFSFSSGITNYVIRTDAGFTCAECGKEFSDQSNCRRHVKNYHNKSNISALICNLCQKTYKNHDSLRHHQRATHGLYKQ